MDEKVNLISMDKKHVISGINEIIKFLSFNRFDYLVKQRNVFIITNALLILFFMITACYGYRRPEDTVKKYCELDFNGATLSSLTINDVAKLYAWGNDGDCPGWDSVDIISSFKILKSKVVKNHAIVTVEYVVLGTLNGYHEFVPHHHLDKVNFKLKKIENSWKINDCLYPRISIKAALFNLKYLIKISISKDETDEKNIRILKNTIKILNDVESREGGHP